jgi:ribosome-associated protein
MPDIKITDHLSIPDMDFTESFARSSGPGGQNVNKVSTAVELRFRLEHTASLPIEVKARLHIQQAGRINKEGELVIFAQTHRSQDRNRADARSRLARMVIAALHEPKARSATKPTRASIERRINDKRKSSEAKATRRKPGLE